MCRNSKFDVDFVDFNRKIDNLTEKVNSSYISDKYHTGGFCDRHSLITFR